MAAKPKLKRGKGRYGDTFSERASPQGERSLQRVSMSNEVADRLDTLSWVRAEAERIGSAEAAAPTNQKLYDEILSRFLKSQAKGSDLVYSAIPKHEPSRLIWLDSDLVQKCRELAERQDVPVRLVLRRIFADYADQMVPGEWIELRNNVGDMAAQLLQKAKAPRAQNKQTKR